MRTNGGTGLLVPGYRTMSNPFTLFYLPHVIRDSSIYKGGGNVLTLMDFGTWPYFPTALIEGKPLISGLNSFR